MDVFLITNKTFRTYLEMRGILEQCLEIVNDIFIEDDIFCNTKMLEYHLLESLSAMEDILVAILYQELQ